MTIEDLIREGTDRLKEAETPRLDTELLIAKALKVDRLYLMMYPQQEVGEEVLRQVRDWLRRRERGCPVQYLLGEREFMGLDFLVEEGVLIPRPDTEILVESVLNVLREKKEPSLCGLEIGCGSGIISLSLLAYCKDLRMQAVDIDPRALALTRKNAERLGLSERIDLFVSDLFAEVRRKDFDFILSNPPYIRTEVIETLQREVKDYEPRRALDGGGDGLFFYRAIIEKAKDHLKKGGLLAFEIGHDQGEALKTLLKDRGYAQVHIEKDLAGRDRTVQAVLTCCGNGSSRKDDLP